MRKAKRRGRRFDEKSIITLCLVFLSAATTVTVLAACGSYFQPFSPDTFTGTQCVTAFSKTAHWKLFFTNGHETNDLQVTEQGECIPAANAPPLACYPGYNTPYWVNADIAKWNQVTTRPWTNISNGVQQGCIYTVAPFKEHFFEYYCDQAIASCMSPGGYWNFSTTTCSSSPVGCPDYCEESGSAWHAVDLCTFEMGATSGSDRQKGPVHVVGMEPQY